MASAPLSVNLGIWATVERAGLRIAGRDLPAGRQIAQRAGQGNLPIQALVPERSDPGLILPTLRVSRPEHQVPSPGRRPSFGQLDQEQRWVYREWLVNGGPPPAVGYAYLYLYGLEAGLFDCRATLCCAEIQSLVSNCPDPAFQAQAAFDLALGAWLTAAPALFTWAAERIIWTTPRASLLLGLQAALGLDITPQQLAALSPACGYTPQAALAPLGRCLQIGLEAFEKDRGRPWLSHWADQLSDPTEALDIRLANPAARFSLALASLHTHAPFRQAVSELVALADHEARTAAPAVPGEPQAPDASRVHPEKKHQWYAVLEFGESSSGQFARAVALAQKQPGYTRLMDERRTIIHRAIFKQREMNQFRKLWEIVKTWKSTRVYIDGEEQNPATLSTAMK